MTRRPFPDSHGKISRRAAPEEVQRCRFSHPIPGEQVEQIFRSADRMAVEREDDVANDHACLRRGTLRGDAHDQQRLPPFVAAVLSIGKTRGLAGNPDVSALHASVLEQILRRFPRDGGWNHDAEAADRRCRRDAHERTGRVDERAAGEAVVHRRCGSNDFVNRAAPAGWQWPSDD